MTERLGVGLLGAGPVTQAIHLPTLARLPDRFRVAAVMDVDASVASSVAARAGAVAAATVDELLERPDVDVVAVCSPHQFHAAQVEAACAAGKRGVLCEKPLATEAADADRIAAAVTAAGVPLVVGAMHVYDPGWRAASEWVGERAASARSVRSTIVLPFNDRYEDWATELLGRPAPAPGGTFDVETRAAMVRGLVLGLSVHDLPLIRAFAPSFEVVDKAVVVRPFGGVIGLRASGVRVDLVAFMRPLWRPDWRLEAFGPDWSLAVRFTPSYVHAGSATAILRDRSGTLECGPYPVNGYEAEWVELHDLVTGAATPRHPVSTAIADLTYVTAIADAAEAAVRREVAA